MFSPMAFVKSGGVVNPLPGGAANSNTLTPTNAVAGWWFKSDGTVERLIQAVSTFVHNWFIPSGGTPGNSYWIRATQTAGSLTVTGLDALNTWLPLSTNRNWNHQDSSSGGAAITATLTIEIASDSGGVNIVGSGVYTISAWETA